MNEETEIISPMNEESFYSVLPEITLELNVVSLPQTDGYYSRGEDVIEKYSDTEMEYELHPI